MSEQKQVEIEIGCDRRGTNTSGAAATQLGEKLDADVSYS